MPTYEYRCGNGHQFDRFYRTISAALAEQPCPECGEVAARQLSGGAGLLFKGSGFYLTDYGKNAHRKPEPDKKKGEGARSEGKADGAKSETKSESASAKPEGGEQKSSAADAKKGSETKPANKSRSE